MRGKPPLLKATLGRSPRWERPRYDLEIIGIRLPLTLTSTLPLGPISGVDSVGSGFANPAEAGRSLARRERCIVVMLAQPATSPTAKLSSSSTMAASSLEISQEVGVWWGPPWPQAFCGATSVDALRTNAEDPKRSTLVEGDMFVAAIAGYVILILTYSARNPDHLYLPFPGV